jgi:transposase-like protein
VRRISRSTVARICAELHERFEAFKERSLYDTNLVVLFLDAINYLPVRPTGPKEGVICAWGIDENGHRVVEARSMTSAFEAYLAWFAAPTRMSGEDQRRGLECPR